jgi:hypothetical protein
VRGAVILSPPRELVIPNIKRPLTRPAPAGEGAGSGSPSPNGRGLVIRNVKRQNNSPLPVTCLPPNSRRLRSQVLEQDGDLALAANQGFGRTGAGAPQPPVRIPIDPNRAGLVSAGDRRGGKEQVVVTVELEVRARPNSAWPSTAPAIGWSITSKTPSWGRSMAMHGSSASTVAEPSFEPRSSPSRARAPSVVCAAGRSTRNSDGDWIHLVRRGSLARRSGAVRCAAERARSALMRQMRRMRQSGVEWRGA